MYASIDIGTNTVLLLIAEKTPLGLRVIHQAQRTPRLGKDVDHNRNISKEAAQRVIRALNDYREQIESDYPDVQKTMVTATSAVRDARNRNGFLKNIQESTGFSVRLLNGTEEATFTYIGAQSVIDLPENSPRAVIDIGGGSTELAWGRGDTLIDRHSFDMGSVRFTERFLAGNPPSESQINSCRKGVDKLLKEKNFSIPEHTVLVGAAGTVTSLAYIHLGLNIYKDSMINGCTFKLYDVRKYINQFKVESSERLLEKYPEVLQGRSDIFLAGLIILEQVMDNYGFDVLTVSTGGIRHGSILMMSGN